MNKTLIKNLGQIPKPGVSGALTGRVQPGGV